MAHQKTQAGDAGFTLDRVVSEDGVSAVFARFQDDGTTSDPTQKAGRDALTGITGQYNSGPAEAIKAT
jgi:hypothetical protein